MSAEALPTAGTALAVGDPSPPVSTHKATASLWGLVPIVLGGVVEVLHQADVLFPDAPPWILQTCALVLLILGPVVSYIKVLQTPNLLKVPVVVGTPAQLVPPSVS